MMIGIFWLAIIFSLSAGQEIDSGVESNKEPALGNGNGRAIVDGTDDKLQVSIYYEALCYDSVSFITNQLVPAWQKHRDQMDLKLVPFGKSYVSCWLPLGVMAQTKVNPKQTCACRLMTPIQPIRSTTASMVVASAP